MSSRICSFGNDTSRAIGGWSGRSMQMRIYTVCYAKKGKSRLAEELRELQQDQGKAVAPVAAEEGPRQAISVTGIGESPKKPQPEAAPREAVLQQCAKTTLGFSLAGAAFRLAAEPLSHFIPWADPNVTSALLDNPVESWHLGVVGLLVGGITLARWIAQQGVPDFADASNRSNTQVLSNLGPVGVVFVSCLPGFSEELLFRGGLIPLLGGQWPAVIAVGLLFGILHTGGGRNASFAVWATAVGLSYGLAYLYTQDLLVPAAAHSLANILSASVWKWQANSD